MAGSANLVWLLWFALDRLDRAHVDQGAGINGLPSLAQWANLLRILDAAGTARRELPVLLRLSKRAVRSEIAAAVRSGWAEVSTGQRLGTVRLTASGMHVAARWASVRDSAEKYWHGRVGVDQFRELRATLESVVALLPLEHPHYPAGYGAVDARITGGNGEDWTAVPREQGDTVSKLPLSALISQALVAFAIDYELTSDVALFLTATVIRRLPRSDGRPSRELGASTGLSALERHGFLNFEAGEDGVLLRLTTKGREIKDAHAERLCAVEQAWRQRLGDNLVTRLRRALANVANMTRR